MDKLSPPTVAITGASGFLGSMLVSHFQQQGWRVIALARTIPPAPAFKSVTYREYDILKPVSTSLLGDADYVVHTAYVKQDRNNPNAFESNVQGAKNLLAAARANKVKKNVFVSSMSAHKNATSSYGRQKLAIEKLFDKPQDISLRFGLIVGNGGIVQSMVRFMRSEHLVPLLGGGRQPLQIINVHDAAKVIERVIEQDISGRLTIANPRVYTYKEFYKVISDYLSIRVFFVPVPFFILLTLLKISQALHLPLDINTENLKGLQKLIAVDTTKDLKSLNIKLDDLNESLRQAALDKA